LKSRHRKGKKTRRNLREKFRKREGKGVAKKRAVWWVEVATKKKGGEFLKATVEASA